ICRKARPTGAKSFAQVPHFSCRITIGAGEYIRGRGYRIKPEQGGERMATIDSTPELAARVYETMERNLQSVRRRLGRPLTLADKVLLGHLDDPETQDLAPGQSYLLLRPDRVVLQDVLGQAVMLQFMQTGRERVAVPTTIHCDHLIQARVEGKADLLASLEENQEVYDFLRSAAARYGAGFWGPGAGIIHQVVLENY